METHSGFGLQRGEGSDATVVEMIAHKVFRRSLDCSEPRSRMLAYLKEHFDALLDKSPYQCHVAPFEVSLRHGNPESGEIHTIVYPDLVVMNQKRFGRSSTIPEMVIEVLTADNLCFNLTTKLEAYEKAGVKTYWALHPVDETVQVYELDEGGRFRSRINPYYRFDEVVSLALPLVRVELVKVFGVRLKGLPSSYPEMSGYHSYADYRKWLPEYQGEIIEGRVFKVLPDQGALHNETVDRMLKLVAPCMMEKETILLPPGANVRFPNGAVRTHHRDICNVVRPDVVVVTEKRKITPTGYIGVPAFIAEVLCSYNREKDEKLKKRLYEDLGVREYWVVDPRSRIVTVHILDNRSKYQTHTSRERVHKVSSAVFPEIVVDFDKVFGA